MKSYFLFLSLLIFSLNSFSADSSLQRAVELANEIPKEVIRTLRRSGDLHCPTIGAIEFSKSKLEQVNLYSGGSTTIETYPLSRPYPEFQTTDEAAKYFINLVREKFPNQRVEYCADILKIGDKYVFKEIIRGTPSACPKPNGSNPANLAAGVHTHPGYDKNHNHNEDLSIDIQQPSMSDYAVAKYTKVPQYMGAPGGHIARFTQEDTECKGSSFYKTKFTIIQAPFRTAKGNLENESSWKLIQKDNPDYDIMRRFICK